jgi:dinuclear metal center YbgI/SA1388 family protein
MNSSDIIVKSVTEYLETLAPRSYQESYDNAGLLTGSPSQKVTGILVSLDCTEEIVDEAISSGCNLIIAHHPIVFKGLKKLTGANYVERTIIKAIRSEIAIYAIHTNLDNVLNGVNAKICEKIGLHQPRVLLPRKDTLSKLVTFIPKEHTDNVLQAMHDAGAGHIGNYKNCSFRIQGMGTFMPDDQATPFIGKTNVQESVVEDRVEVILPTYLTGHVVQAMRSAHPYEEVAYYLETISNENQEVGSGMIGHLEREMEPLEFLRSLKVRMDLTMIRHTKALPGKIKKVAVCGGAGSFLLPTAIQQGADMYISADFKYHEFFDADGKIMIADIGHYESEVFTKELIKDVLIKKFPTFAINFSKRVTNPISYI